MSTLRILFVCLGNICRSPMAEGVFRHLIHEKGLQDKISTDSAGTGSWHIGSPPDDRAQATLLQKGIDISDLKGRQATTEDFHNFDYIFAMDQSNHTNLKALQPANAKAELSLFLSHINATPNEVPDPYYGGQDGFDHVYELVSEASQEILAELTRKHY